MMLFECKARKEFRLLPVMNSEFDVFYSTGKPMYLTIVLWFWIYFIFCSSCPPHPMKFKVQATCDFVVPTQNHGPDAATGACMLL